MPRRKNRRINPHRKPVSRAEIDQDELVEEQKTGALCHAWLLILSALLEIDGITAEQIVEIWSEANQFVSQPMIAEADYLKHVKRAEALMGMEMPYRHIDLDKVRNEGDLDAVKRKLKENAVHAALCLICLGLETTDRFTADEIGKLFLNADITLAEIESGRHSYQQITGELENVGISTRLENKAIIVETRDDDTSDTK